MSKSNTLNITPATEQTIGVLAELFGEYQTFYNARPDKNHNLKFLRSFLDYKNGVFFLAQKEERYIGYTSLYFSYSSVTAKQIAILNDLYVQDNFRGQGVGKTLIDFAVNYVKELKISQVRWCTRIDNAKAQKLYAKYNAKRTDWYHYDLSVSETI